MSEFALALNFFLILRTFRRDLIEKGVLLVMQLQQLLNIMFDADLNK